MKKSVNLSSGYSRKIQVSTKEIEESKKINRPWDALGSMDSPDRLSAVYPGIQFCRYMDWEEFAKEIEGELKDKSAGFVLADTTVKEIYKEWEHRQLKIKKKIWRSHGASSHSNVEKIEIEYLVKNLGVGKLRISRKNLLRRIGRHHSRQYEIQGDVLEVLKDILEMKELQYLLKYPKSAFIILGDRIKFNARSTGEMKEEIQKIFDSIETLLHKIEASISTIN